MDEGNSAVLDTDEIGRRTLEVSKHKEHLIPGAAALAAQSFVADVASRGVPELDRHREAFESTSFSRATSRHSARFSVERTYL